VEISPTSSPSYSPPFFCQLQVKRAWTASSWIVASVMPQFLRLGAATREAVLVDP